MKKIRIDGSRTQTLRTVLLAAFAAVAVVLLGALGLHKLAQHGIHLDLPGRLGVNIQQTANGFTYSQSQGGHTIFTIHASKIIELKADQADLHDVQITLYGPPGTRRRDSIKGSEFLYDRKSGLVTGKGHVVIDMASPAAPSTKSAQTAPPDTIHVETSDLTFNQNSDNAVTAAPLSFTLPHATGKSVGGSYNSKSGVLVLQSNVELHTDQNGEPSVVYAEHAQLLRNDHIAYLLKARNTFAGNQSSADEAILHFRPDGTLQHLDAQDHVHAITADGAEIFATTATGDFDAQSQPIRMTAGGGVNFISTSPNSNMHGNAVEGTILFVKGSDGKPALHHAQFRNAVSFVLQQNSLGGNVRGSATREMTASTLDVDFVPGADGKSIAKTATARGGAHVNLHDLPYNAPPRHTDIAGQQLQAQLAFGHELRQVDGVGGTSITYYLPDGATDTSRGDTLHATFLPVSRAQELATGKHAGGGTDESAQLDTAVQQGRVSMEADPATGAKSSDGTLQQPLYATGSVATYQGSTNILHLSGTPQQPPLVHNDNVSMTDDALDYNRTSSDATAAGDVRATMVQKPASSGGNAPGLGGSGPAHVVAASARMTRATNTAVFFGAKNTPARLWQGSNSVTAPVLELTKQGNTLHAHDAAGEHATDPVHAVFLQKSSKTGSPTGSGPMRVASDTLVYSDSTRMGDFHGSVVAQQPNGTVHSDDAQVFLTEAARGASAQGSSVERMVATGHVAITQPGRRGCGDKLVFTASDGNYLLTGTPCALPRATDAVKGETTGAALLFRSSDNSVQVLSSDAEGMSHRTVTDTRTSK